MKNLNKRMAEIVDIDAIKSDYAIDFSLFTKSDDKLLSLESQIKRLTDSEWTILILYAEYESLREVGKMLGCSHSTVRNMIALIREKLLDD